MSTIAAANPADVSVSAKSVLTADELRKMDAYWRAAIISAPACFICGRIRCCASR